MLVWIKYLMRDKKDFRWRGIFVSCTVPSYKLLFVLTKVSGWFPIVETKLNRERLHNFDISRVEGGPRSAFERSLVIFGGSQENMCKEVISLNIESYERYDMRAMRAMRLGELEELVVIINRLR